MNRGSKVPTPSEFEEKEFETQLVLELGDSHQPIWTPGQTLENQVAVDIVHTARRSLFSAVGRAPMFGIWMGDAIYWNMLTRGATRPGNPPPDFRANVFIQVKRSHTYETKMAGLGMPCWKMDVEATQQARLETLNGQIGDRALFCYAAPAFDKRDELFTHSRNRKLVNNSTFPSITALAGHSIWKYDRPGAVGIAHSDPEQVNENSFLQRVGTLRENRMPVAGGMDNTQEDLRFLAERLMETILQSGDPKMQSFARRASRRIDDFGGDAISRQFAKVAAFARAFRLAWFCA